MQESKKTVGYQNVIFLHVYYNKVKIKLEVHTYLLNEE